jgi:serum/glucocorticoid-regulated kinase 2
MVDSSKNNIGWLIDFMGRELEQLDPNVRGLYIGVKTVNISVPVDYLLARRSLQLSVLQGFTSQLAIEPVFCPVPQQQIRSNR